MGDTSCSGKCGLIFLLVLNFIFFLIGCGVLTVGVVLKTNSGFLDYDIQEMLNGLQISGMDLGDLLATMAYCVIGLGALIMIISGLGLFGACCKVRWMLLSYAIVVLVILALQITALGLWAFMRDKAENWFDDEFNALFESEFKSDDFTAMEPINKGLAICFMTFKCCGGKKYDNANNQFENTPWWSNSGGQKISVFCCKDITVTNYASYNTSTCHTNPTENDAYIDQGCTEALKSQISQYSSAAVAMLVILSVLQGLGVMFACMIASDLKKIGAHDQAMKA